MLTQHLTTAVSWYLFVSQDCQAVRVERAIDAAQLPRLGLRPVVVVTLAVEKLSIYWQRLYFADEPIPLASFLYLAWVEFPELGGIPKKLKVDEELLTSFPLKRLLIELDPETVLRSVEAGHDRWFGATKRANQRLPKHCVDVAFETKSPSGPLPDQAAVLARLNQRLEHYHRAQQENRKASPERTAHLAEVSHRPRWPHSTYALTDAAWLIRPSQSFFGSEYRLHVVRDLQWCVIAIGHHADCPPERGLSVTTGAPFTTPASGLAMWQCYPFNAPDFASTVSALPFPASQLLGSIITDSELEQFFDCTRPISSALHFELAMALYEKHDGLFFIASSREMFADVASFLGGDGSERRSAELFGGSFPFRYRVFAHDNGDKLNFLVVLRGSAADRSDLAFAFDRYIGRIDLGIAAFTAIDHCVGYLLEQAALQAHAPVIAMTRAILATCPAWHLHQASNDD